MSVSPSPWCRRESRSRRNVVEAPTRISRLGHRHGRLIRQQLDGGQHAAEDWPTEMGIERRPARPLRHQAKDVGKAGQSTV